MFRETKDQIKQINYQLFKIIPAKSTHKKLYPKMDNLIYLCANVPAFARIEIKNLE